MPQQLSFHQPSAQQIDTVAVNTYSRRTFLTRAAIGAAAAAAATVSAGRLLVGGKTQSPLPGPGSIFEPRRNDLLRHWQQKLSWFRLK
jgi:hypothetical protein